MLHVGEPNSFEEEQGPKGLVLLLLWSAYIVEKHCDEKRTLVISYDDPGYRDD